INYIWINTYYMDKYSSSELCKAINFMCRWSNDAVLCYAYLDDCCALACRGWLAHGLAPQKLIAPGHVRFYTG
ncbi:hypothetical protein J3A83DRAFT_4054993, partial [Scleroderma citrinum]